MFDDEFVDRNAYLPFGVPLTTENLNEVRYTYQFTEGQISDRLKQAIGFKEGDEYPWVIRMKALNSQK